MFYSILYSCIVYKLMTRLLAQYVTWSRGMSRMSQILFLRYRQRKHQISVLYCFHQHWFIARNSVTRYPILMGFALTCSIIWVPESGVEISKLQIFKMRLISLDRVTYVFRGSTHTLLDILLVEFLAQLQTINKISIINIPICVYTMWLF